MDEEDTKDEGMGIAVGRGCCRRRDISNSCPPQQAVAASSVLSLLLFDRSCPPAVAILVPVALAYLV